MKNYFFLLLCIVAVPSKSAIPEPPSDPVGPFDLTGKQHYIGNMLCQLLKGEGKCQPHASDITINFLFLSRFNTAIYELIVDFFKQTTATRRK